ncbi:MAG: SpoIIE family protein phosphatase, partial [Longimicrobiales bacterium]|nr:SpoIIE family protein phosphatase [Longimicrobiales bacterium]
LDLVSPDPDWTGPEHLAGLIDGDTACVVVQNPDVFGRLADAAPLAEPVFGASLDAADGLPYEVRLRAGDRGIEAADGDALVRLVSRVVTRVLDLTREVHFFTLEMSERFEEINLLYSIAETLGSVLQMEEAGRLILKELCDVLGAHRSALWVLDPERAVLELTASVGEDGPCGPIAVDHPQAVTARVFREGRSTITTSGFNGHPDGFSGEPGEESLLSVPIRYTPPGGGPRTVGVINLVGRRNGGRFTAADQKLLAAIASQVGASLENNRLMRQNVNRERMAREMELAHNLQQKLLPPVEDVPGVVVSARVEPAEQVGGDFYQVFRLGGDRVGVMIGDVSTHGFPAALIMALAMSAASIYAAGSNSPAAVLRRLDDALREELETTEMYLSLFYGVIDPASGTLAFSNAGHPHAFLVRADQEPRRLAATDPPVGFAGPEAFGESRVPWDPARDRLFLFTDGLSDTLTSQARPNGEAFVLRTVRDHHHLPPKAVVDLLFRLARDARPTIPSDDRTAVLVAGS